MSHNTRTFSVHSNVLLIGYAKHIQAWANQVNISLSKEPALFYISPQIGESNKTNKAIVVETVSESHSTITNNIYDSHRLEPSAIPYLTN